MSLYIWKKPNLQKEVNIFCPIRDIGAYCKWHLNDSERHFVMVGRCCMLFKNIDKLLNIKSMCFKIKYLIIQFEISNYYIFHKCSLHFKVINENMFTIVKSLEQHFINYHIKTPSNVIKVRIYSIFFQRIHSDVIKNCFRRQKLCKQNCQAKGNEMPKYFCFI